MNNKVSGRPEPADRSAPAQKGEPLFSKIHMNVSPNCITTRNACLAVGDGQKSLRNTSSDGEKASIQSPLKCPAGAGRATSPSAGRRQHCSRARSPRRGARESCGRLDSGSVSRQRIKYNNLQKQRCFILISKINTSLVISPTLKIIHDLLRLG